MRRLVLVMLTALAFAGTARAAVPQPDARAFYVVNSATGEVLASKNADERVPIASITKLMTVLVALQHVAPGIPAAQHRSEAERLAAFEHECEFYCTKWGLQHGTSRYSSCVSDLHQFRTSVLKQLAADDF